MAGELLYYDDVEVGFTAHTGGIVITESHVVQFAGLSGDFFDQDGAVVQDGTNLLMVRRQAYEARLA